MSAAADRAGALFMVLAMAGFALEDSFFKAATAGSQVGTALMIFGAAGLVMFAARSKLSGEPVWHPACMGRTMLIRSAFELMGRLFFALALAYAPLSSTSAILQAAPLLVTLGAIAVFGETVGWRRWLAMAAGLFGVMLIIRPGFDSFQLTSLYALLATIGFAGRDLATRASPPAMSTAQLGSAGFAVIILAALILIALQEPPLAFPAPRSVALALSAGIIGYFAYSFLTRAMRSGDVGFVAPYRYTRLVFAMLIGVTVFGERPDALTLIGAAIIVAAGVYGFARANKLKSAKP